MPYSFIAPVSKSPFSPAVRRIWYGGAVLTVSVLAAAAFLHFKSGEQRSGALREAQMQESLRVQVEQLRGQQSLFTHEKRFRQQTDTANQLVAEHVSDLLDLIPGDATLERFDMDASTLLFEGECRRFEALRTDLVRALSGQYRLAESVRTPGGGKTHFILRFAANGGTQ